MFFRGWLEVCNFTSYCALVVTLLVCGITGAQESESKSLVWKMQESNCDASFRGLHVLSDDVVWASGTGGTVLRTLDGGTTWTVNLVQGAEELDFRDIHAVDKDTAVILSAGQPARVYRTNDGGKNWKMTFQHPNEKSFFDAISFWDNEHGIAMSDPIDGHILLIRTDDGGETWKEAKLENRPKSAEGEGGFAASGTNMVILPNGRCLIALGSALEGEQFEKSRVVYSDDQGKTWQVANVPMARNQSSGIFSMAFSDNQEGVAVGGDYVKPDGTKGNLAITSDGGKTWTVPSSDKENVSVPSGYRSGVAVMKKGSATFVAVGTNGTDWSNDGGKTWSRISDQGFNAIRFTADGKSGWAVGGKGEVGRWVMPK